MVRLSNPIITTLNILTLLISLVAIAFATWLHLNSGATPCARGLQRPVLVLGASLLAVSLVGLAGSWRRVSALLWAYLALLFVFILGMVCFTMFTIVVTNKSVGKALSGKGYNEARLGDYSHWLQKYVVNAENWDGIKSCLVEIDFCRNLAEDRGPRFYKNSVAATQWGCCRPPTDCGFKSHNATYWTRPPNGGRPEEEDPECKKWSNVQTQLCFDCESCKKAVLYNIQKEWKKLAIINASILVVVVVVYSVGCCALRSNRAKQNQKA
nr:tetraspanin-8-like [Ipomoea batatas]